MFCSWAPIEWPARLLGGRQSPYISYHGNGNQLVPLPPDRRSAQTPRHGLVSQAEVWPIQSKSGLTCWLLPGTANGVLHGWPKWHSNWRRLPPLPKNTRKDDAGATTHCCCCVRLFRLSVAICVLKMTSGVSTLVIWLIVWFLQLMLMAHFYIIGLLLDLAVDPLPVD